MPHIPQVKTNLSGQQMGTISRGIFSATSAASPVQRPKTGATWTAVNGAVSSAQMINYAAGKWVITTNTTTGYYSTNGTSWTSFTFPSAMYHLAGNNSGKWVFASNWSTSTVNLCTTTDFVTFNSYTQSISPATDWYGYKVMDWDATLNKFAFCAMGGSTNARILHSTSGDSGTWTTSTINSTGNNYASSLIMGNGYAYIGNYGDGNIQYSTNLTSWTTVSVGQAQAFGTYNSIDKNTGEFVHGSNYNVNGGQNPRYIYGLGSSISNTYFADSGLWGSNMTTPSATNAGGFIGWIPNATRGATQVYTEDPSNTTWTITNPPIGGAWKVAANETGWGLVGFSQSATNTIYVASS
jgi:hypothetical protein